ncbi:hypothetical protein ACQP2Y_03640 [Actinoplanes sp. CA-051413]|uniref:hypothetical protein n=1 Tax=Actinoplanes sp. CA-051413 TaxID=3239899 RepID=UPI003D963D9E
MIEDLTTTVSGVLRKCVAGKKAVVFCSQQVDVPEWRQLLSASGAADSLVLPFDGAPLAGMITSMPSRSAAQLLAARHALLATLAKASPLTRLVSTFDPAEQAVLIVTDPLDPQVLGRRAQLGAKHPSWALAEHKSVVDTLWDAMGVERAESVVLDQPGTLIDHAAMAALTVSSWQRRGTTPTAGGDGVSTCFRPGQKGHFRVRIMPRLAGMPCRLHGLISSDSTVAFTPLELLVVHQVSSGSYLPLGACPVDEPERAELIAMTRHLGSGLRQQLAYRGGFSVDGILTSGGFRPTDFNGRVTSALEHVPPPQRVAVHVSAVLARAGLADLPAQALGEHVDRAFHGVDELLLRAPLSGRATETGQVAVRWSGTTLVTAPDRRSQGELRVGAGSRGTILTARLRRTVLPATLSYQSVAIAVFGAADRLLGTGFGQLEPPD